MIKIILACLVLTLCTAKAHATDIVLDGDEPTLRVDGSAIESIDGYNIYYSIDNAVGPVLNIPALPYTITDVQIGLHTFQVSAIEDGQEGILSDPISLTVSPIQAAQVIKMVITVQGINVDTDVEIQ